MDLDEYLTNVPDRKARSPRSLPSILREAYTYGVPALIMKSSTDRLSADGGYSFFLGTPDVALRRIASWLITKNSTNPSVLCSILRPLWSRHGREDIAMCALLLANLDHARTGTRPWALLESLIRPHEPIEGLLLCVEEILRSGRQAPSEDTHCQWLLGDGVMPSLALLSIHASMVRGRNPTKKEVSQIRGITVSYPSDIIQRVKDRIILNDQV